MTRTWRAVTCRIPEISLSAIFPSMTSVPSTDFTVRRRSLSSCSEIDVPMIISDPAITSTP